MHVKIRSLVILKTLTAVMLWMLILGVCVLTIHGQGDQCTPNPCMHGTCIDSGRYGRSCNCYKGFGGDLCERCAVGFYGQNCEKEIDYCSIGPCKNGNCTNERETFWCRCEKGYAGTLCEEINACTNNPCNGNGKCSLTPGGFSCQCYVGYSGTYCETKFECLSSPCANGGLCTEDFPGFTCHCPVGFSGHNCSITPSRTFKPEIKLGNQTSITVGTKTAIIPCFAAGIPLPHITWKAIDGIFPSNVRQLANYLVVQNVTSLDDKYYMCTAINSLGFDIQVTHIRVEETKFGNDTSAAYVIVQHRNPLIG